MFPDRATPTLEEREQLRRFVHVVHSMRQRRFIRRFVEQNHTICFVGGVSGPEYDRDDLDAFLTDYRKVAMSVNEPVFLTKVLKTLGKYATPELRGFLKNIRETIVPRITGEKTLMNYSYPREDGSRIHMSLEKVLSTLANGEIFHVDPGLTGTASELRARNPLYYLWPVLHYSVIPVVKVCVCLYHAIRQDGILGELDYPVPYPLEESA